MDRSQRVGASWAEDDSGARQPRNGVAGRHGDRTGCIRVNKAAKLSISHQACRQNKIQRCDETMAQWDALCTQLSTPSPELPTSKKMPPLHPSPNRRPITCKSGQPSGPTLLRSAASGITATTGTRPANHEHANSRKILGNTSDPSETSPSQPKIEESHTSSIKPASPTPIRIANPN